MKMLQPASKPSFSSLNTTLCQLDTHLTKNQVKLETWSTLSDEASQVDWLILHFNHWFSYHNVKLIRGEHEPEYFPATKNTAAQIQFAHGFFNSALHEISHWTIAGPKRRTLPDLGYWYAPDGRTQEQQQQFEQVEVKPQAIEWLFSRAFDRPFRVSLDNLTGDATDSTAFKDHVYLQVSRYLSGEQSLPRDALHFIHFICLSVRDGNMLNPDEFLRSALD